MTRVVAVLTAFAFALTFSTLGCALGQDVAGTVAEGGADGPAPQLDGGFQDNYVLPKPADVACQVYNGGAAACARKTDKTLWCWGISQYVDGSIRPMEQITELGTDVAFASVGGGICAVKLDGSLWCWGSYIGDGTTTYYPKPVQVTALAQDVKVINVGAIHCAIKNDDSLWCWGSNMYGMIGDGTKTDRLSPIQVMTNVKSVSSGTTTCAVKTDGTLWCWGLNGMGSVGDGTVSQGGNLLMQLTPKQVTAVGNDVLQVGVGQDHVCAVKSDGSLWCWGWNIDDQLGGTSMTQMMCNNQMWTGDTPCSPNPAPLTALAGKKVVEVVTGLNHTCALTDVGEMYCWGENYRGECGQGGNATDVTTAPSLVPVSGKWAQGAANGALFSCARTTDGNLYCWGEDVFGNLGVAVSGACNPSFPNAPCTTTPVILPFSCPPPPPPK